MVQTGQNQAQAQARVELDGLGVVGGGRARETGLQGGQHLDQAVLLPHHQDWDQQGQGQTGTGASDGTGCVFT